jgi:hypothetical protein
MNERIRELAEQARNYALDEKRIYEQVHNTEQCMEEYREVYNKKFAELIVRECADACYKHKDVESFGIYPVRVAMVTKACSDNIKEHFGVE